jgi:ribonuclease HI
MLLSIDRVLQLLAEGKTLDKIAELAECGVPDVQAVIEEARSLMHSSNRALSKKKIIIKKGKDDDARSADKSLSQQSSVEDFLQGAEISAVPLGSELVIYTDGASRGTPGPAGIGIVIYDNNDHQVGKVSLHIGTRTNNFAEYTAIIRALMIARFFQVRDLKIRTDSELVVKQVNGEYQVKNENIRPLYNEVMDIIASLPRVRIEHVTRNLNDKADYLAKKAVSAIKWK